MPAHKRNDIRAHRYLRDIRVITENMVIKVVAIRADDLFLDLFDRALDKHLLFAEDQIDILELSF